MQIVHATFKPGEGKQAVSLLENIGVDIEDYKLIASDSGDLLIINLLYGNTDKLLDSLTTQFNFESETERSLIIFTPDSVIPRNKEKTEEADFHATRESLITFAQENSRVNFQYLLLVIASATITSLGLILDNVAVIVGGMVIAPVLGPILALTIGIMLGDARLIRRGVSAEVIAIVFAILVGVLFGLITPDVGITNSLRIRMFPTIADLIIAAAAGTAGAFALIKGQLESGLVGVMVAASLVPVMSTVGIGIAMRNETMIVGPLLLLAGNYLALILTNITVFYFEGLRPQVWYKHKAEKLIKKSLIVLILAVVILSVPLGVITVYQFYIQKPVELIKTTIRENLTPQWNYRIEKIEVEGRLINVYLYAERELERAVMEKIKQTIEERLAAEYNIVFKIIPVQRISL